MSEEKLRKPLPGRCPVRLRAGSYCTNYPLPGSQFCNLHSHKEREWANEKKSTTVTDDSLIQHYDLVGELWKEATTKLIYEEDPSLTLVDIFDFIEFCLEDQGIFTERKNIAKWFIDTKEEYNHLVELLELKNRFHMGGTPFRKLLEEGIPLTSYETLDLFFTKNPNASIDEIIEATGFSKQQIYNSARELGYKLEGQRGAKSGKAELGALLGRIAEENDIALNQIVKIKDAVQSRLYQVKNESLYVKFSKNETSWNLNVEVLEGLKKIRQNFFICLMYNDLHYSFIFPFDEISDYIDTGIEDIRVSLKSDNFLRLTGSPVFFEAGPWLNNYKLSRDIIWD